ncbi:tetratricopeptide repeat protein, partial [Bifidobacterium sp. MA2]
LLVRCLDAGSGVEIRGDGERTAVYLDGRRLDIDLNHVASYRGDEQIQELEHRYRQCDLEYRVLREAYQRNGDDDELADRYARVASEHVRLARRLAEAQTEYLGRLARIAAANDGGRPVSPRLADAYHALQNGDVPHALEILDLEAITTEAEHDASAYRVEQAAAELHARLAEQHRDDLRDRVSELLARDDALQAKPDTPSNREQRLRTLETAADLELKFRLGVTARNRLATYYYDQGDYNNQEIILTTALALVKQLIQDDYQRWAPDFARTLNNLADMHKATNKFDQSENEYQQALELRRELVHDDPDAYGPDLAESLSDLADLHERRHDSRKAESEYQEALGLRRELAGRNPDKWSPHLAQTLNDLASLHAARPSDRDQAETEYREAVKLRRELARRNPDKWNPALAESLCGLADLKAFFAGEDASNAYEEAVELYRGLTQRDPGTWRPGLVRSLCGLADQHERLARHEDAEAERTEAIRLLRALVRNDYERWISALAENLRKLADLHRDTGNIKKAMTEYTETLRLYRRLARQEPTLWNGEIADVLYRLAGLHKTAGRFAPAEQELREALQLYQAIPHKSKSMRVTIKDINEQLRLAEQLKRIKNRRPAAARPEEDAPTRSGWRWFRFRGRR